MKKLFSILIIAVVVTVGCSSSKTTSKMAGKEISFEYYAYTRGSSVNYVVTKDSVTQKEMVRGETIRYRKPVRSEEWEELLAAIEKVDLDKLETLEVPSKKHQFDGALGATLKIIVDGKEYRSATFDHGNPPEEIKEIVEDITLL